MNMGLGNILERIREGLPVIVVDGKNRENEGDLLFAAQKITVQWMAFMIRHTSGIICTPMLPSRAKVLGLRPLIKNPTTRFGCKFTMPVDVQKGVTTGVSAADRVRTMRALANPGARPNDFGKPGHVFPLISHPKGLAGRRGHTEAAIALLKKARMREVGVIAELINDDGAMMRGARLARFAARHKIPIVNISELKPEV